MPDRPVPARLARLDAGVTPAALAAARWFRSKQRPISTIAVVDRAPLPPAELVVAEVSFTDAGQPERYLLPLVDGAEPRDGDGAWAALVRAIEEEAVVEAEHGRFVGARTAAFATLRPQLLDERRLGVEQSNTSVVIGDRLILKLYRLLEPGESPDLEVSAFLTDAGFADVPAVAGAVRYQPHEGQPAAAAMLQAYVPSVGDAWAAMLVALADDPDQASTVVGEIGALTARLHAALASRPSEAFPSRPATVAETAGWRASAERQLAGAIASVAGEPHRRLVELAAAARARFADTFGAAGGEARVSRIHGDLHLGQLLALRDGGFSVIDFEGEPARPLAERRAPSSPLRDVAGLLRSLDYAARTVISAGATLDADRWLAEARDALLAGYGRVGPAEAPLLEAFELEKACYEVRYEAGNRPDWLWLPLGAVERLVA